MNITLGKEFLNILIKPSFLEIASFLSPLDLQLQWFFQGFFKFLFLFLFFSFLFFSFLFFSFLFFSFLFFSFLFFSFLFFSFLFFSFLFFSFLFFSFLFFSFLFFSFLFFSFCLSFFSNSLSPLETKQRNPLYYQEDLFFSCRKMLVSSGNMPFQLAKPTQLKTVSLERRFFFSLFSFRSVLLSFVLFFILF